MPDPFDTFLLEKEDGWQIETAGVVQASGVADRRTALVLLSEHAPAGRPRWLVMADGRVEPIVG